MFADGARDEEYLRGLEQHVPRLLDAVQPDLVFYLAGADPYEGDRLGRLKLTVEGLQARDHYVFRQCAARNLPVAVTMSGGYAPDVEAIVQIHMNTIAAAVACVSSF
jgi:acetoin utilization deacetylase AcuC-like enzyme